MRINLTGILLVCCMTASLMLSGCKEIRDMNVFSGGSSKENRSEGVQGKFIDTVRSDLTTGGFSNSADRLAAWKKDVGYVRYGNKTLANLPELQDYLNDVLSTLGKGLPGASSAIRVYITPQKDFEAYTLENGAIFVSLGTLLSLESEDELAALLAHEFAHVLLDHHSKDTFEIMTQYGMRYANLYLQAKAETGQSQEKRMQKLKIANWVTDKALFPNWNKGQENDADILAVDLLVQSGYNADAMTVMLKKVEQTVLEKKEFVAQNPVRISDAAKQDNKLNIDLDVLAANVIGSLEHQLDRDYESAKVRQKRVRDYLKKVYKKRPRPGYRSAEYQAEFQQTATKSKVNQYLNAHQAEAALLDKDQGLSKAVPLGKRAIGGSLGEDPYTRMLMYYIRNSENKTDTAQINLEKAYKTGGAPMYSYELLVEQHIQKGQFEEAKILLDEIQAEFDNPDEILPRIIGVQKKLGKNTASYLLRCLVSADVELIKQCNQASKS